MIAANGDFEKRMVAGLLLVSLDWCWDEFLKIEHPLMPWALSEFKKYVKDGDNAPEILRG